MGILALFVLAVAVAWVGHACILTATLNNLYGRSLPKRFLKLWRHSTAFGILAFPLLLATAINPRWFDFVDGSNEIVNGFWGHAVLAYANVCLVFGGIVFPFITVVRLYRTKPACVVSEQTRHFDFWPPFGEKLVGDGKGKSLTRVPGNCVFKFDLTEMTLAIPNLPPEWNDLTILLVSDLHFHGTPSRVYFDRVMDELCAGPVPDVVCVAGDLVDTFTHHSWIEPVLSRLQARDAKFAVLGNHDKFRDPERVRAELTNAGYAVLGNNWREVAIRGVKCVVVGHEGPWFAPAPDLSEAPRDCFRLCLSHSPDNFYWGIANAVNLMLCGHVHGGGIRIPVIGSIFVPSVYGRRFDHGVFEKHGTAMVVNRGISGREPLRIRCNPQAIRLKLIPATLAPRN